MQGEIDRCIFFIGLPGLPNIKTAVNCTTLLSKTEVIIVQLFYQRTKERHDKEKKTYGGRAEKAAHQKG